MDSHRGKNWKRYFLLYLNLIFDIKKNIAQVIIGEKGEKKSWPIKLPDALQKNMNGLSLISNNNKVETSDIVLNGSLAPSTQTEKEQLLCTRKNENP